MKKDFRVFASSDARIYRKQHVAGAGESEERSKEVGGEAVKVEPAKMSRRLLKTAARGEGQRMIFVKVLSDVSCRYQKKSIRAAALEAYRSRYLGLHLHHQQMIPGEGGRSGIRRFFNDSDESMEKTVKQE